MLTMSLHTRTVALYSFYSEASYFRLDVPSHLISTLLIIHFMAVLYLHARQQEWTYRLDFLWTDQVRSRPASHII